MSTISYEIWAEVKNGDKFLAFHWIYNEIDGIQKAYREAVQFGIELVDVWAVPYILKEEEN